MVSLVIFFFKKILLHFKKNLWCCWDKGNAFTNITNCKNTYVFFQIKLRNCNSHTNITHSVLFNFSLACHYFKMILCSFDSWSRSLTGSFLFYFFDYNWKFLYEVTFYFGNGYESKIIQNLKNKKVPGKRSISTSLCKKKSYLKNLNAKEIFLKEKNIG